MVALPPSLCAVHPLALLALGQAIVLLDFRVNGFDLVPDPLGWAIGVAAMSTLAGLHHGFVTVGWAGVAGTVVSLPNWVDPDAFAGLLNVVLGALSLLLVVSACTAIKDTLPTRAASAHAVRGMTLVVTAVLVLVILLATAASELGALVLVVGLVALGVHVWFLVLLVGSSTLPRPPSGRPFWPPRRTGPAVA